MAVTARLYRNLRGALRHRVMIDATLRDEAQRPQDVALKDLSATGVRLPATADLEINALITLGIAGIGMCNCRVIRQDHDGYGCEFLFPLSGTELLDALTTKSAAIPLRA
jgi:hypothetical protein